MARVTRDAFVLSFEGPATEGHQISVDDLAASLLGMSAAFRRAQQLVSPEGDPLDLNIQASREGSFEVDLSLSVPTWLSITTMFTGVGATTVLNAAGLGKLFFDSIRFLRKLATRSYTRVQEHPDGQVTIAIGPDGVQLTIDAKILQLCEDPAYRDAVERTVAPLAREGIETMNFRERGTDQEIETIPATERSSYESNLSDGPSTVTRDEVILEPKGVEFDWRKWRVNDGNSTFFVEVADDAFRQAVDLQQITIGAGDLLKVRMRTVQTVRPNGKLSSQRTVEKVIERFPRGQQGRFTFPD